MICMMPTSSPYTRTRVTTSGYCVQLTAVIAGTPPFPQVQLHILQLHKEPACSTSPTSHRGCCFSIFWPPSAATGSQHASGPCPFLRQCKCAKSFIQIAVLVGFTPTASIVQFSILNLNGFSTVLVMPSFRRKHSCWVLPVSQDKRQAH